MGVNPPPLRAQNAMFFLKIKQIISYKYHISIVHEGRKAFLFRINKQKSNLLSTLWKGIVNALLYMSYLPLLLRTS